MGKEQVRALLAEHQRLLAAVDSFEALPEHLLSQARLVASQIRQDAALQQVASLPISRLKDTTRGLRLDALERGGCRSVADLARADERQLVRIPNVGEATARQAIAAARQVVVATERTTVIRFDVTERRPEQTTLLTLLRAYDTAARAVPAAAAVVEKVRGQPATIAETVGPAAKSKVARLFIKRELKESADQALADLEALLHDPAIRSLRETADRTVREATRQRPAAEVWADYERDAAKLLGVLAEVTGRNDDPSSRGFLPEEIVAKVDALTLDLSLLTASLRGYQAFGAKYALVQRRTILGDEMGLGKTVEALAALCHLRAQGEDTALVVCPASVVANWRSEIHRHTKLDVHVLHGPDRDRAQRTWHRSGGVAIATFEGLRRLDPGELPAERTLSMLIVDEAHYVKNPRAKRSEAVARWGRSTERVLFLTGTPMENRIDEFQALVGYLQPDVARRVNPAAALAGPAVFQEAVAPAYLRRNQTDVLDELPEMIQSLDWNDATPADAAAYRRAVFQGSFMAMRRAAYQGALATPMASLRDADESAKLARLVDLAEEAAAEGLKLVVFSFFREVLDLVGRTLSLALPGAVFGPLTGSTSAPDRQRLVDSLSNHHGGAALVAQIEAGGVGLNIQAASVVILCEPQWKPTIEAQAIARCHRMGQVRRVQVHRLLLEDTVDQRMLEVLADKQQLINQFVRESAVKEASPAAVDISDLANVEKVVDEANAEAAIIEWERRRLDAPAPSAPLNQWAPPTP